MTLITSEYNKKTIAVDHWGESKRHFFCKALNLRSVLLICWIWSTRSSQKYDCTMTWQTSEQQPANFALNSGAWNVVTPLQPICLVKVMCDNLIHVKLEMGASYLELFIHKTSHWKHQLGSTFPIASFWHSQLLMLGRNSGSLGKIIPVSKMAVEFMHWNKMLTRASITD